MGGQRLVDHIAEGDAERKHARWNAPPPKESRWIVRTGIERQRAVDERHHRDADFKTLLVRVKGARDALEARDAECLRAALIDVAATAEAWAAKLPGHDDA